MLFVPFRFHFSFFFLFVEKYAKQTKPILTRIVGDTVQESCLFGGKRKDKNYRGCYYSLNPLGKIGEDCFFVFFVLRRLWFPKGEAIILEDSEG